ncbi:MAG: MFS transporter [Nodosilinea sp.]
MASPLRSTSMLWAQVGSLALVQGAISLTWVIYNLYLVKLLTGLGFPQAWAAGLLVVENLLAIVMEPLMGTFSDRRQHDLGTRFPMIALGVILAAGLFFLIPTALVWGQHSLLRWLLPLLLVAWALAMTIFRSPALSLLGRYAFRTQLPQAASVLTLVGGLAGAMGPFSSQWILSLGAGVAFGAGSVVLLGAMAVLGWVGPNQTITPPEISPGDAPRAPSVPSGVSLLHLALVFGAGVGVTLGFRLMMTTFPIVLKQQVANASVPTTMGMIFLALALTALPAGSLATRLGNRRAMVVGLALLVLLTAGMLTIQTPGLGTAIALLFGGAFSLVANGTIPFALQMVPPTKAGLGTGMYFSGGALALSLWGFFLGSPSLPPQSSALLAALAFLGAGLCVGIAQPKRYGGGQPPDPGYRRSRGRD